LCLVIKVCFALFEIKKSVFLSKLALKRKIYENDRVQAERIIERRKMIKEYWKKC
jgi:hypothetical protein